MLARRTSRLAPPLHPRGALAHYPGGAIGTSRPTAITPANGILRHHPRPVAAHLRHVPFPCTSAAPHSCPVAVGRDTCPSGFPTRAAAPHGAVRGLASRAPLPGPVIARRYRAPLPRPLAAHTATAPLSRAPSPRHYARALPGRRDRDIAPTAITPAKFAPLAHPARHCHPPRSCPVAARTAPAPLRQGAMSSSRRRAAWRGARLGIPPPGTACKMTENPFLRRNGFSFQSECSGKITECRRDTLEAISRDHRHRGPCVCHEPPPSPPQSSSDRSPCT